MTPLEASRAYLRRGIRVVPVPFKRKGPVLEEWQALRLTEAELPQHFNGGRQNIGGLTGDASGNLVDSDLDCDEAVAVAPVFLPPTACWSGRQTRPRSHAWYRTRTDIETEKHHDPVRLAAERRADPAADPEHRKAMLIELRSGGAQTLLPPSVHPTGDPYQWDEPGEPALVDGAALQAAVRRIAACSALIRYWPAEGIRHDLVLCLAGMFAHGGLDQAVAERLIETVTRQVKGREGATAGAIKDAVKLHLHAVRDTYARVTAGKKVRGIPKLLKLKLLPHAETLIPALQDWLGLRTAAVTVEDLEPPAPIPPEAAPLAVPTSALLGVGWQFAELYARYLEPPPSFFYFAFLTYFGAVASRLVTLLSALRVAPRLYTVILGESADDRKSTALTEARLFFRSLGPPFIPATLLGAGSAEGLAAELAEVSSLVLHLDEMKTFVDKCRNDGSVLLPMTGMLFEATEYENRVKDRKVQVGNAHLSLAGACTVDTWSAMFDSSFFAIGFLNRLWLVADRGVPKFPIPTPIPLVELTELQAAVRATLEALQARVDAQHGAPIAYPVTPDAQALFGAWYFARTGTVFEKRLDTYGHRLMVLLAASSGAAEIDTRIMTAVIDLLTWQLQVRRETDPVDAENRIARIEGRIRAVLSRGGSLEERLLKQRTHYQREGIWAWTTALENLLRTGEVHRKGRLLWLALPSPVANSVAITFGPLTPDEPTLNMRTSGGGGVERVTTEGSPPIEDGIRPSPRDVAPQNEVATKTATGSRAFACSFCHGTDFVLDRFGVRACRACFVPAPVPPTEPDW